jgi:hypothetical protein
MFKPLMAVAAVLSLCWSSAGAQNTQQEIERYRQMIADGTLQSGLGGAFTGTLPDFLRVWEIVVEEVFEHLPGAKMRGVDDGVEV